MPTVTELYQAITTGATLTVPNPNLKPERASSYELAAEYKPEGGRYRVSLFREDISDALLSQSAPLVPGSTTLFSYVQNVDRDRTEGVELVADQNDVVLDGLELSGSLTYANGRIVKDSAFAAAVGKFIPQLPKLRGEAVATYHFTDALAATLAGRYSDRSLRHHRQFRSRLPDLSGLRRLPGGGCPHPLPMGRQLERLGRRRQSEQR